MKREHGQLALDLRRRTWGGARTGAGRKRVSRDTPHRARPVHRKEHPVHVVLRTEDSIGRLRCGPVYRAIGKALSSIVEEREFRVVHLSIQNNHLHLLVEAGNKEELSRGMQRFGSAAARAINDVMKRKGKVFRYRFHATEIKSPRQMRCALSYVLNNWRKHREDQRSERARAAHVDPYSSGVSFAGWQGGKFEKLPEGYAPLPVAEAKTWMLRAGWRRYGDIGLREVPRRA